MGTNLPSLDDIIEDYLLCCITEGKSPRTIEWYSYNLGRFNRYLESQGLSQSVRDIGRAEARRFIFHLENDVAPWK